MGLRRVLSPNYIGVASNGDLEVPGTGTWSQVHATQLRNACTEISSVWCLSLRGGVTMQLNQISTNNNNATANQLMGWGRLF